MSVLASFVKSFHCNPDFTRAIVQAVFRLLGIKPHEHHITDEMAGSIAGNNSTVNGTA